MPHDPSLWGNHAMAAVAASSMLRLTPRPYQHEAVAALLAAAARGVQRPLLVLPTGTGKTIIFTLLVQRRGGRALILAHRDELIQQAVDKLHLVDPTLPLGIVQAERDELTAPTVVASVQTLSRRPRLARLVPDFHTIVIDEAHHAPAPTYRRILEYCHAWRSDGPLVVGVTATPERGDRQSLREVFDRIVYQKILLEMMQAGYLVDLRALQVLLQADFDALRTSHGDFVEAELETLLLAANAPVQVLGRGTRTYPGKTDCLILDVVGVSTRHTLHTTATLCGCDPAQLAQQSVLERLDAQARPTLVEEDPITGTLRSTPVDLFARRTLRWVQTRQGAWVLSPGAQHGTLRLRTDGPNTWQVVQVRRDADPVRLGDTLPLPYAQGLAEDYARHLGVARLVEAEAPWRQQPATEKQTALLRKLGLAAQAGLTKGEAAELLAAVLGDWD